METKLKSPYPYFGGKSRIAAEVWRRFGSVSYYVEPFAGSMAMLLARSNPKGLEVVNDIDGWLCNFWRAVKVDPDAVAEYAADPVSELDLHARGDWLFYRPGVDEWIDRLRGDPDYYDVKSAGWWVWGKSAWIAGGWGREPGKEGISHCLPHIGREGVHRKLPTIGRIGINRRLPSAFCDSVDGITDTDRKARIRKYLCQLGQRMSDVLICCGDWVRVLGPTPTKGLGTTAIFLDPPYGDRDRDDVYEGEHENYDVAIDVQKWCMEWGDDPLLRIAVCGYEGEHNKLESHGWSRLGWKALGGYGNQSSSGNSNRFRERIWFSSACKRRGFGLA